MVIYIHSGRVPRNVMLVADNYAIGTDDMNVILHKKSICSKGPNKGKEQWEEIAYFPTHRQAINDMISVDMLNVYPEYRDIVERIDYLHERIDRLGKALDSRDPVEKVYRNYSA